MEYDNSKLVHKILIFLSGPIFNFIFAIIFFKMEIFYEFSFYMFYTNLLLGCINLLPILPLDGGNILDCILEDRFNFEIARKISLIVSKFVIILISLIYCFAIFYLKNLWIFLGIAYLWYLYFKEEKNFELYLKISNTVKLVNG